MVCLSKLALFALLGFTNSALATKYREYANPDANTTEVTGPENGYSRMPPHGQGHKGSKKKPDLPAMPDAVTTTFVYTTETVTECPVTSVQVANNMTSTTTYLTTSTVLVEATTTSVIPAPTAFSTVFTTECPVTETITDETTTITLTSSSATEIPMTVSTSFITESPLPGTDEAIPTTSTDYPIFNSTEPLPSFTLTSAAVTELPSETVSVADVSFTTSAEPVLFTGAASTPARSPAAGALLALIAFALF